MYFNVLKLNKLNKMRLNKQKKNSVTPSPMCAALGSSIPISGPQ